MWETQNSSNSLQSTPCTVAIQIEHANTVMHIQPSYHQGHTVAVCLNDILQESWCRCFAGLKWCAFIIPILCRRNSDADVASGRANSLQLFGATNAAISLTHVESYVQPNSILDQNSHVAPYVKSFLQLRTVSNGLSSPSVDLQCLLILFKSPSSLGSVCWVFFTSLLDLRLDSHLTFVSDFKRQNRSLCVQKCPEMRKINLWMLGFDCFPISSILLELNWNWLVLTILKFLLWSHFKWHKSVTSPHILSVKWEKFGGMFQTHIAVREWIACQKSCMLSYLAVPALSR